MSSRKSPTKRTKYSIESFPSTSPQTKRCTEHTVSPGSPSLRRTVHTYGEAAPSYAQDTSNKPVPCTPRQDKPAPTKVANGEQKMSALLRHHVARLDKIAELKLAWESHPMLNSPCSCGGSRTVLCRDCIGREPLCPDCFLLAHKYSPFHYARQFNGFFCKQVDLSHLGHILHLGHLSNPCPSSDARSVIRLVDVVDINGVHACHVQFCECEGAQEPWEQLLLIGLYPSTISKPATAFTFQLLYMFEHQSALAKTSALDFVTTMRRITNNAFPDDVPNFYEGFRRASRIWRVIQAKTRAGDFHNMKAHVTGAVGYTDEFHLALKCPACPQPGMNMAEPGPETVSDADKHKYTLYLSIDGNFKQQLKQKNNDPDDADLFAAFFPDRTDFEKYIASTKTDVEKSTCANLKANNLQSRLKFLSMQVSGVVSCKCARHDFFRPGSTVDLKKGESFAYTDYALQNTLRGFESYPFIDLSYDISCQYSKKIQDRFTKHFPRYQDAITRMVFHLPKLHCHGHSDDCRYTFSFDFSNNVGRTHGERIESGWAEGNLAGPSTREMNPGHRHEVLSSFYNEWNYQQTIRLPAFLSKKLIEARRQSAIKDKFFSELSNSMGEDRVNTWMKLDVKPRMENGQVFSVYRVSEVKAPTIGDIQQRLRNQLGNIRPSAAHLMPSDFVAEGIRLETSQRELQIKIKGDDAQLQRVAAEINSERIKLKAELDIWRDDQTMYMPDVLQESHQNTPPEQERLVLPSSVLLIHRTSPWYKVLAGYELELRKGQADTALCDLRLCLKYRDYLNGERRTVSYGNQQATRTAVLLRRASGLVDMAAAAYRIARSALLELGMSPSDGNYKELKPADVRIKVVYGGKQLGDGTCTGSWIWARGSREALTADELFAWEEEGNKVEWFRARIDMQQWREEVEILQHELVRTFNWFTKYSQFWRREGQASVKPGYAEYAYHKAYIFSRRADDVVKQHANSLSYDVQL